LSPLRLPYDRRVEKAISVGNGASYGQPVVLLVGMMGAGKSTVGRAISKRTGWPYVDNDELVRSLSGRDATEIRATDGEDVLHAIEDEASAAVVLDPIARAGLRSGPYVVWLRARPETLRQRVGSGAGRRVEATDEDWLAARAAERAPLYAEVASLTVDVDDLSPDEVTDLILAGLSAAGPSAR
jgi:shikimate kinase